MLHRSASRSRGVRLRVWNTNSGGTFIVTVLAVEGARDGWLRITVTCDDPTTVAKKPKLADKILDVVEFDDVMSLHSRAEYTNASGLDDLDALIDAPERRLPVIVAAPLDGDSFDSWNKLVNRWTQQTVGIAHVISLDPHAAEGFRTRHGQHAVRPGTLRTYPAGADLSDPVTGRTARWLSHKSLAGADHLVTRTIESFVRQHAAAQPLPLPRASREWARAFDRIASGKLREAVTPPHLPLDERRERFAARRREHATLQPTAQVASEVTVVEPDLAPSTTDETTREVERLRRELAAAQSALQDATRRLNHVQETLMVDNLSEASLLELVDLATRDVPDQSAINTLLESNDSLERRLDGLEADLEEAQTERAEARKDLARLEEDHARGQRQISYLQKALSEHSPQAAYAFADQDAPQNPLGECPATWELLAQSTALEAHKIILTAPPKKVAALTALDADGAALTAAWEALGTLAAYREAVEAGTWDQDVHAYCESAPVECFHVAPSKHSRGETKATKKDSRFQKARLLPVPKSVDARGKTHMWAHFKPHTWAAEKRLRIHYLDQVPTEGKIYIGHIGEHLPSASTTKVRR
ncbi:hypothetical protein [Brachybacterium atlanticum]|uniref:hypothetical protein n=1 Tax=Brachybacterium atlanticum TaxID=2911888 RepID=UPI0021E00DB5|nr:hypothetical protein [Brachybacterium atlanticum]